MKLTIYVSRFLNNKAVRATMWSLGGSLLLYSAFKEMDLLGYGTAATLYYASAVLEYV
jgi:hypothetical protein